VDTGRLWRETSFTPKWWWCRGFGCFSFTVVRTDSKRKLVHFYSTTWFEEPEPARGILNLEYTSPEVVSIQAFPSYSIYWNPWSSDPFVFGSGKFYDGAGSPRVDWWLISSDTVRNSWSWYNWVVPSRQVCIVQQSHLPEREDLSILRSWSGMSGGVYAI